MCRYCTQLGRSLQKVTVIFKQPAVAGHDGGPSDGNAGARHDRSSPLTRSGRERLTTSRPHADDDHGGNAAVSGLVGTAVRDNACSSSKKAKSVRVLCSTMPVSRDGRVGSRRADGGVDGGADEGPLEHFYCCYFFYDYRDEALRKLKF
ncbi:hypothetical protein CBR_g1 [Chara braunii]|uniref:Uncharacterized protein n=1 Tax=Chara braunii TaxID=69332 RepID=A0A388JLA1_CHABU|nr:hypothetical protein CBR_g1 [Chara braunii]|eukprot:GBG58599.1 hypothetical protein CBR_g1 [Chara braunii]